MNIRHDGRNAIVTGAGSGIGRAIALRLAADGASVGCLDVNAEAAEETTDLVRAAGAAGIAVGCDVRDRGGVGAAVQRCADELGQVDYVVNNAGLITMTGFTDLDDDEWDLVVDVNLKGQFIVAQVAARVMSGGAIVNLSTVESEVVVSSSGHCQPHYNASKGGVKMLTKALAVELAAQGIRVNAVAPGPINTGFSGGDLNSDEARAFLGTRLLVPRVGEPDDVAMAVSFLLSDAASFITGTQLVVDGGWLTR